MMNSAPVIFIIYNRPEATLQVFDVIKKARPKQLFIIGDGPKNNSDKINVDKCRLIVNEIDWECEVKFIYSEVNLGCAKRIMSGLDLVFNQVDMAIILEDDCLPHIDFFKFCNELLLFYEYDQEIMHISGFNVLGQSLCDSSYFYSKFILPPWGWATWKRAWTHFNDGLDTWQKIKTTAFANFSQDNFTDWTNMFENVRVNRTTWDVSWNVDIWKNKGLAIIPQKSLIQNIGFKENATFTKNTKTELSFVKRQSIDFPLLHPEKKVTSFEKEIEDTVILAINLNSKKI